MPDQPPSATFLFTDIEGSTRLWEREPEAMRRALARHDALSRDCVQRQGGRIVKGTGDGVHAVFDDPLAALRAALELQLALAADDADGLRLQLRCGLHCGAFEGRDGDFYGPVLNRAARIMSVAHGGQVLLSQALAERLAGRLPADLALLDLGRVRLRDLSRPERVHQLLHPGLRDRFPPLRSLEATPNNLALQLNSFVGREEELDALRRLLAQGRLLTLLGMGGLGKSRLSVQLAAELLDEHPDGVWLVELAPLADARGVPQALASVLGVRQDAGQSVTDALLAHVRDRTLLVILDNCEHLAGACAELAGQLLRAGPGVRLLATSRDVLQLAGETVYQVPALPVPPPGDAADPQRLMQHAAVRLFVDRARAAQSGFELRPDNAAAVARICRGLDGIPLALELAAARTRALPVEAIAARLSDRFRLLVSADQTVLPRQRTLRALIDWSHDLLGDAERVLFRRLAVFAGGWTLEAAEAVGAGDGLDAAQALELLVHLVDKSLVVLESGGGRYRMLETVRAYALEQLEGSACALPTRRRHVAHCLALAEAARSQLAGPEQGLWLQRLDQERENLMAAHAWCGRDAACAEQGLQLVFVLKTYWHARGLLDLGHRITVEALQRPSSAARGFGRCRVLNDAGQLCVFMGRHAEARGYLEESHAIARELGDAARLAAVLQPLGMVYAALGERERARASYESAVELARTLGNPRQLAAALNALAQLHRSAGEIEAAEALYRQVLTLARELQDPESVAIALLNRAMLAIARGEPGQAAPWLREVLSIAASTGSRPVEISLLEVCAGLCASRGDWPRCARFFGAAEARASATGIRRDSDDEAFLMPRVARARSALGAPAFAGHERAGREQPDAATDDQLRELLAGG